MSDTFSEIKVSDNFLSREDHLSVLNYCENASYEYGEVDKKGSTPTGMVHNIPNSEKIYHLFSKNLLNSIPDLKKMKMYRMYINCFAPSENPYFHVDGESGITFLYYPQTNWSLNDGGETQFYINGDLYGITPEPNRMVMFDARLLHRATTFRNKHRFTVAIKFD